jgi:hypothetical protein
VFCREVLLFRVTRARKRVSTNPATIDPHQIQGPRHEACETNVSVEAAREVAMRRDQQVEDATRATASTGHR